MNRLFLAGVVAAGIVPFLNWRIRFHENITLIREATLSLQRLNHDMRSFNREIASFRKEIRDGR